MNNRKRDYLIATAVIGSVFGLMFIISLMGLGELPH